MIMNFSVMLVTIVNIVLLIAIIIVIYKGIKTFKSFVNKNKEMDKKLDDILEKIDKDK